MTFLTGMVAGVLLGSVVLSLLTGSKSADKYALELEKADANDCECGVVPDDSWYKTYCCDGKFCSTISFDSQGQIECEVVECSTSTET